MKIAVIGAGISGNLCARLLHQEHEVTLFEASSHPGGHALTVEITVEGRRVAADCGFMVYNRRTYPNFCRMLELLGIAGRPSDMSFSVRCERSGLEYQGSSLNGLFAQRANLLRPRFYRMLREILRFNRQSLELLESGDDRLTIGQYLDERRYSEAFRRLYLVPMGAAIWSADPQQFEQFPARFLVAFFHNHGLLQLRDRPQWMTVPGGSRRYVEALLAPLGDRVRLNSPVAAVERSGGGVQVTLADGEVETFDEAVLATHADQSLAMLADADSAEREVLAALPYQRNEAVLHTDASLLPRRRRAWASWNYHVPPAEGGPVAVTYDLNRLQGLGASAPILLTLNYHEPIDPARVLRRVTFHHPVFGPGALAAQRRWAEISGTRRIHFAGAYWGNGFHEDGVQSALNVCGRFGLGLASWKAVSTKASSSIAATVR